MSFCEYSISVEAHYPNTEPIKVYCLNNSRPLAESMYESFIDWINAHQVAPQSWRLSLFHEKQCLRECSYPETDETYQKPKPETQPPLDHRTDEQPNSQPSR